MCRILVERNLRVRRRSVKQDFVVCSKAMPRRSYETEIFTILLPYTNFCRHSREMKIIESLMKTFSSTFFLILGICLPWFKFLSADFAENNDSPLHTHTHIYIHINYKTWRIYICDDFVSFSMNSVSLFTCWLWLKRVEVIFVTEILLHCRFWLVPSFVGSWFPEDRILALRRSFSSFL